MPKAHSLFDGHALEQHKRLDSIGDLGEDFRDINMVYATNVVPGIFATWNAVKGAKSSMPDEEISRQY